MKFMKHGKNKNLIGPVGRISAIATVLRRRAYLLVSFTASATFLLLFMYFPDIVTVISGSSLLAKNAVSLSVFSTPWWGYGLTILLALLLGLLFSLQVYVFRNLKARPVTEAGAGFLAGVSGIGATIFGSATCVACLSALLAFVGPGTIVFFIGYRWHIMALSVGVTLASLYLVANRIQGNCEDCKIR